MKKIIFLLLISIKCYSQTSIPSSGAITMTQIATVMYNLGEISYAATLVPYSLSYLNSASHLTDKTAPFSISDWYGYASDGPTEWSSLYVLSEAPEASCYSGTSPMTIYTPTGTIGNGIYVYTDLALTTKAPIGSYAIGSNYYFISTTGDAIVFSGECDF